MYIKTKLIAWSTLDLLKTIITLLWTIHFYVDGVLHVLSIETSRHYYWKEGLSCTTSFFCERDEGT